jgi:hypothetical protein
MVKTIGQKYNYFNSRPIFILFSDIIFIYFIVIIPEVQVDK